MSIRVVCTCGKAFDVPDSLSGRSGRCKSCGKALVVPKLAEPFAFTPDDVAQAVGNEPPPTFFASADDIKEQRDKLASPIPIALPIEVQEQDSPLSLASTSFVAKKPKVRRDIAMVVAGVFILGIGLAIGFLMRGDKAEEKPVDILPEKVAVRSGPKLSPGVKYEITRDEEEYNPFTQKHFVEVYLNRRVTMADLEEIADEIARNEKHEYQRRFVWYFVSNDHDVHTRHAWARTDYLPANDFGKGAGMFKYYKIEGLTIEDKEWLDMQHLPKSDEVIGEWEDSGIAGSGKFVIFTRDGTLKFGNIYPHSKFYHYDMKQIPDTPNPCFQPKGSTDIYEINPDGNLRVYNVERKLIARYPRWKDGNN